MRNLGAQPSITFTNGALLYSTPYNPLLVARLKQQVPASARQWDKDRGVWLVAPQYGAALLQLTEDCFDVKLKLPAMPSPPRATEIRILDVRYIGKTKERGDGERTAFGWCDGSWSVIFSEASLRCWFGLDAEPQAATTLYGVLGLRKGTTENDIRKAYRRLALQWHPDRCREPNAKEQFIAIQHAYEVLNNPLQRNRYDAGLALEATLGKSVTVTHDPGYRSPLRCGLLLCEGVPILERFVVSEIRLWEDIVDGAGMVLSTSWPAGADMFVENWSMA